MALKIDTNMSAVAYHVIHGAQTFTYSVDAQSAIGRFPDEWSDSPWSQADAQAARKRAEDRHAREVEEAKAGGLAPPAPLAPVVEPTPEEQAAIDEHAKGVAEAKERLDKFYAEQAEKKQIAEQVAADEALVASAPPRPDPNAPRRPFGRKGELTPAEKAAAEKKAAADKKIVDDKAQADAQANSNAKITQ